MRALVTVTFLCLCFSSTSFAFEPTNVHMDPDFDLGASNSDAITCYLKPLSFCWEGPSGIIKFQWAITASDKDPWSSGGQDRLDRDFTFSTCAISIPSYSSGLYKFWVQAEGPNAGQWGPWIPFTFRFDGLSPATPTGLTNPGGGATTADSTPNVTWTGSTDSGSGIWFYEVRFTNGTTTYALQSGDPALDNEDYGSFRLESGNWTWQVRAFDVAGNVSASSSGKPITVSSVFDQTILKWAWTTPEPGDPYPAHSNVVMVPSVIDLDNDGAPEVVFSATSSEEGGSVLSGVLRVLRGTDGSQLFTVLNPAYWVNATSSIATGDIDADGSPEIIACDNSGQRLIAFEHDGTFKWRTELLETINWGAPAIADLDQDGAPEIVMGRQALDKNGNILWTGTGGRGHQGAGPLSLVSDVDLDGHPEIVAGNTVYSNDGAIKWQNTSLPDGYNAVANFDEDKEAEIVLVSGGNVWLLEHNLLVKWGPKPIPGGGQGGPPTVADYDGDGLPEIGVASAIRYTVFETDGTVKWEVATQDNSSSRTGSSAFDFDGDGSAEAVYRDELKVRISRGADGVELFDTSLSSCTFHEYPFVADIDGDTSAELIVVANTNCQIGSQSGIYIYADPLNSWGQTRRVWNQYTYHITNVNEDGSIPLNELENWVIPGLNSFRMNGLSEFHGPSCSGDFDGDGDVDGLDLATVAQGLSGVPISVIAEEFGRADCFSPSSGIWTLTEITVASTGQCHQDVGGQNVHVAQIHIMKDGTVFYTILANDEAPEMIGKTFVGKYENDKINLSLDNLETNCGAGCSGAPCYEAQVTIDLTFLDTDNIDGKMELFSCCGDGGHTTWSVSGERSQPLMH